MTDQLNSTQSNIVRIIYHLSSSVSPKIMPIAPRPEYALKRSTDISQTLDTRFQFSPTKRLFITSSSTLPSFYRSSAIALPIAVDENDERLPKLRSGFDDRCRQRPQHEDTVGFTEETERVVLGIDMDSERTVSVWQASKSEILSPGMGRSVPGPEPGTAAGDDEEVEAGDERSERMGRNAESGWDMGI
jgi:hypothetical protein